LLFAAGDPGEIEVACEGLQIGWQDEQALYFHHSLLEALPPILRVYCGCAEAYCGDLGRVDLIKLHRASGKLTFLVYDDIEHQSVPELRLRIKVNLRTGFVQVFDHSADHQVLLFKERFFGRGNPKYQEWLEFGNKLRAAGIAESGFIGPSREELDRVLARSARGLGDAELAA
jgi:DNA phosphorothioation-associated putative methyltransferase